MIPTPSDLSLPRKTPAGADAEEPHRHAVSVAGDQRRYRHEEPVSQLSCAVPPPSLVAKSRNPQHSIERYAVWALSCAENVNQYNMNVPEFQAHGSGVGSAWDLLYIVLSLFELKPGCVHGNNSKPWGLRPQKLALLKLPLSL